MQRIIISITITNGQVKIMTGKTLETLECKLVHALNGKKSEEDVRAFYASREPLYYGIVLKPGIGLWEIMKSSNKVIMECGGDTNEYVVKYSIDVGENSFFFLTPSR